MLRVPVPPEYGERRFDRARARSTLGCGEAVLDLLVERGLPVTGRDPATGGPLFDYYDLVNVGLASGTGLSLGEQAQRSLMRFALAPAATWTGDKRWALTIEHRCPAEPCCGDGRWEATVPDLGPVGGRIERWQEESEDEKGERACAALLRQQGVVVLHGDVAPVVAADVRKVFREAVEAIVGGEVRYQWMPRALRTDPAATDRLRLTDCAVASRSLAERLVELGFEARTRKSHVLGLVGVEHIWVQVVDADGSWKVLDPILAALAEWTRGANPEFGEFCLGSISNRVLPWLCGADEDVAVHVDGDRRTPATTAVIAEPVLPPRGGGGPSGPEGGP